MKTWADRDITKTLNKHHAMTESELCAALGKKTMQMTPTRRMELIKRGRMQYIIIPNNTACKYKLFKEYAGMRLYYTTLKHLKTWIKQHTPKNMSLTEKRAFSMRIHRDFRVDMEE